MASRPANSGSFNNSARVRCSFVALQPLLQSNQPGIYSCGGEVRCLEVLTEACPFGPPSAGITVRMPSGGRRGSRIVALWSVSAFSAPVAVGFAEQGYKVPLLLPRMRGHPDGARGDVQSR